MKGIHIAFNYAMPKCYQDYLSRMALFSGTGKKYSISYATSYEEKSYATIKEIYENLGVKNMPESLAKIEEAVKNEASGIFILLF
jgi:hypothetical protein